jgi:hypothetical protein
MAAAFVIGWIVSWSAIWLIDRSALWERVHVTPVLVGKWDPAERDPISRNYQKPAVPTGRHFFRRAGPFETMGRVLAEAAEHRGYDYAPYRAMAPVRVAFDRLGYRSEYPAEAGGTAIIGSSYVEAAFAAAEDTIPGWLRRDHTIPAANFGTAYTGGEAVLSSLEKFVMPTRPRHIVWLFAERADFGMLVEEQRRIGAVPAPLLGPLSNVLASTLGGFGKSALLSAADTGRYWRSRVLGEATTPAPAWPVPAHRYRIGADEVEIHLTAFPALELVTAARPLVGSVLERMQRLAEAGDATFSVVYLPARVRTLRGLELPPARIPVMPRFAVSVQAECEELGIPFTDTTDPLRAALRRGELIINPVWDTHLNSAGMRVVAGEIAELLAD